MTEIIIGIHLKNVGIFNQRFDKLLRSGLFYIYKLYRGEKMQTNYYLHINEGGLSSPTIINLKDLGIDDLKKVDFKDRPEKIINALDDFLDWSKSSWEDLESCDIRVSNPDREIFLDLITFQTDNGTRGIETRQTFHSVTEDRVVDRYFFLIDEDIRRADPTSEICYEVSAEDVENSSYNLF